MRSRAFVARGASPVFGWRDDRRRVPLEKPGIDTWFFTPNTATASDPTVHGRDARATNSGMPSRGGAALSRATAHFRTINLRTSLELSEPFRALAHCILRRTELASGTRSAACHETLFAS